ncbi:hypothetical protein LOTGIDRAFT_229311 [Lottia gigantea]|uniref:Uncharacterized protein n=1 Tax=Lottia gigantea TaxID=225164 RepID=V3ZS28_LOTGI|nr:hypothetical protein LOTGIDRAFT_229311 [Lottia gigantea]ESO87162.1 hypothetical protein LOTGIDRAFT_229311 [Lottia gigantea]
MSRPHFHEQPSYMRDYENQSMSMFLPPDENVQELGEINMGFDSTINRGPQRRPPVDDPVFAPAEPTEPSTEATEINTATEQ